MVDIFNNFEFEKAFQQVKQFNISMRHLIFDFRRCDTTYMALAFVFAEADHRDLVRELIIVVVAVEG